MAGKAIAGMALDAVGSVVNNLNNELQMERTFGYNERAAKKADARTRALFTDLYSPEAKVAPIKDLTISSSFGSSTDFSTSGSTSSDFLAL